MLRLEMAQKKFNSLDHYKTIFLYTNQVILFYLEVSIVLETYDRINHLLPYDRKIHNVFHPRILD